MRRVVIAGAGIVGTALAADLSAADGVDVTVVERGPRDRLLGSTEYAPGFVGLLSEASVMTALARASATRYETTEQAGRAGFDRVGGLEVAGTESALDTGRRRVGLAVDQGLPAQVLDPDQVGAIAPDLVDRRRCLGGVFYPMDGTARAGVITVALRDRAESAGARFIHETPVVAVDAGSTGVRAVRTAEHRLPADDLVIACGIWGPAVAALAGQSLPLVPVQHPYVYGPAHGRTAASTPFVRWTEHHVYLRDHGDRLGLGSYDHMPLPADVDTLATAELPWPAELFDPAIRRAIELLPERQRFSPAERLNGVFAMTADNLPMVGPLGDIDGLWAAEALWVTHAAGAAGGLADLMLDRVPTIDGLAALRPDRFTDRGAEDLTAAALRQYSDVYITSSGDGA